MPSLQNLFLQTVALVNEPPGSLVYHLVLLFALEAAAVAALGRWRQTRLAADARLALGLGLIFVLQLAAGLVAVLAAANLIDPLTFIPPLDRAASALTIVALIWLFAFPEQHRAGDALTVALVLAGALGLGVGGSLWAQDVARGAPFFNGTPQETAWEVAQLFLLAGGLALLLLRRPAHAALGAALLILLLVGHSIHYLFPLSGANVAGAERLARILALPLLTALAYRAAEPAHALEPIHVPADAALPPEAPPAIDEAAAEPERKRWALDPKAMTALMNLGAAANPEEMGRLVTMAVGRAFIADVTLLLAAPDTSGKASIACAFNLIRENFPPPLFALPLGQMPELSSAFNRGEAVRLTVDEHVEELSKLSDALAIEHPGPALVVPLTAEGGYVIGALALMSPFAQRAWSAEDQNMLMSVAGALVTALTAGEQLTQLQQQAAEERGRAEETAAALYQAQAAQSELAAAVDEAHSGVRRLETELDDTRHEMERQRQDAEQLIAQLEAEHAAASSGAQMAQENEEVRAALAVQAADRDGLTAERDRLAAERDSLTAERDRLAADLNAARAGVTSLARLEADAEHARQELEYQRAQSEQLSRELEGTRAELRRLTEKGPAVVPVPVPVPLPVPNPEAETAAVLAAKKAVTGLQGRLDQRTNELATAREELKRLNLQLDEQGRRLAAKPAPGASNSAALEKRIAELEAQLAAAPAPNTADSAALGQRITELESQLAEAGAPAGLAQGGTRVLVDSLTQSMEAIASLSQELRQPMSSIVGYSDLLMGESVGILGALQRKFLERIKASTERMGALLDDLIRVTALDSGKLELTRETLDVVKVVDDAILGVGAQFREKGINLQLNIADDLPPVTADRDAMRQVLGHLLNNAGSASAIDGEVTLTVQRESEQPRGGDPLQFLFISVRDSGGGITLEDQPRVFSRLYRADAPLIAGLGDTGVGLSIAKALVEAHAGRIWVNSEMGQGSTFCVLLPIDTAPGHNGGNGAGPH